MQQALVFNTPRKATGPSTYNAAGAVKSGTATLAQQLAGNANQRAAAACKAGRLPVVISRPCWCLHGLRVKTFPSADGTSAGSSAF